MDYPLPLLLRAQELLGRLSEWEKNSQLPKAYVRAFFLDISKKCLALKKNDDYSPDFSIAATAEENTLIQTLSTFSVFCYRKGSPITFDEWKNAIRTVHETKLSEQQSEDKTTPLIQFLDICYQVASETSEKQREKDFFFTTFPWAFWLSSQLLSTPVLFCHRFTPKENPSTQDILEWFIQVMEKTLFTLKKTEEIFSSIKNQLKDLGRTHDTGEKIFTHMLGYPSITLSEAIHFSGVTKPNANILLKKLVQQKFLSHTSVKKNKRYLWINYLSLLSQQP